MTEGRLDVQDIEYATLLGIYLNTIPDDIFLKALGISKLGVRLHMAHLEQLLDACGDNPPDDEELLHELMREFHWLYDLSVKASEFS